MATSMKKSLKNRLGILSNNFAIIQSRPDTSKKGIYVGIQERGPLPSSDKDGRIYRLAVPVIKKIVKNWSFHVVVVQRRQRNVQKSVMHVQSCCFVSLNLLLFRRSLCRRRHRPYS